MSIVQSDQLTLVTGATGSPHVSSAEAGEQNIAAFGTGVVALDGSHPVYISGGAIHINAAELMFDGRHITIPSPITYPMDTAGTYAYKVYLRYTHDSNGQESATIEIAKSDSSGTFDDSDYDYLSPSYSPRYGSTTARRQLALITTDSPRRCYNDADLLPTPLINGAQMVVHQDAWFSGATTTLLEKLPRGATVYTGDHHPCQLRGGTTVQIDHAELELTTTAADPAWSGGVQIRAAISGCIMHADIRAVCQVKTIIPNFQQTYTIAILPEWARPSSYVIVDAPVTSTSRTLTKGIGWGVQISPTTGEIAGICLDEQFQLKAGDVLHASVSWIIPTA